MKKNGKLVLSIILSVILIVIAIILIIKLTNPNSSEINGEIQVKIIELDGTVSDERSLEFTEGDSLFSLLDKAYDNLELKDGMIMTIGSLTTPADWKTFILIKINGEDSNVGILEIELFDGMVIEFVDTEVLW